MSDKKKNKAPLTKYKLQLIHTANPDAFMKQVNEFLAQHDCLFANYHAEMKGAPYFIAFIGYN